MWGSFHRLPSSQNINAEENAMYCPYCGESNEEGYVYCGKCGNKLPTQPGQAQGVLAPPPFDPSQARSPARISVTPIVAGVLVLAFAIMLGWIIFGKKDKPGLTQEAAITQKSTVFDASAGSQQNDGAQEQAPLAGQESIPQQPASGGFIAGKTTVPAGPASGVWELALLSSEQIPDYGGKLPAEGHVFHRLELLAVNTGDTLASSSIGSFTAEWQGNTYSQMDVKQLQGNIPPGWPLKIEVVFDLPAIAQDPVFKLQVLALNASERYVVNLNELDSQLEYEPVQLSSFDKTFEIPGQMSIKPTGVRCLSSGAGDNPYEYLMLDASVGNLGGYDLNMPGEARKAGLSFQVITPGNIYPVRQYEWASPAAGTAEEVDASRYNSNPRPVPPGYTHDGAFFVRNTDIQALAGVPSQPVFSEALLLVWLSSPTDLYAKPTDWALYPLDEASAALVELPLAPIDLMQSVLEYAQQALQEGNWMRAASLYGALFKAHPGDQEYARKLDEIQAHTGRWVFAPYGFTSEGAFQVYVRPLWATDEAATLLHEIALLAAERPPVSQQMYAPDGSAVVEITLGEGSYQASITDLSGSGVPVSVNLPMDATAGEYLDGNVYTWSNDGRYLLFPFIAAETRGLSLVLLDKEENAALRYNTCAIPNGVVAIAWSPDGASVAYTDQSGNQIGIAPLVGDACRTFPTGSDNGYYNSNLVWSADDRLYAVFGNELKVFSPDGSLLKTQPFATNGTRIFLSPDQRYLTALDNDLNYRFVYDLQTGEAFPFERSQRTLIGWIP
jgi:hypothetical protein